MCSLVFASCEAGAGDSTTLLTDPTLTTYARASDIAIDSRNNVYIVGYYGTRNLSIVDETQQYNNITACYWKNGEKIYLSVPAGTISRAYYIAITPNDDVYIAGSYGSDKISKPCYWKNGARTDLNISKASLSGIAVAANGDVYIAGHYNNTYSDLDFSSIFVQDYSNIVWYWKNGTKTDLSGPTGATYISTSGIAIAPDNKVYIAGRYYSTDKRNTNCFWEVGGVRTDLSVPAEATDVYTTGIAIGPDSKVYIAGYYRYVVDANNLASKHCYWLNGARTDLSVPAGATETIRGYNAGIAVSANDVYVLGGYYIHGDENSEKICYWKNGMITAISVPNAYVYYTGIAVSTNSDIYISGINADYNTGEQLTCFWKNGVRTDLQ